MALIKPGDWQLFEARPGKNIYSRVNGDEVEFLEEWIEDPWLEAARLQRELYENDKSDFRPLAVIPPSVKARAIKEGWDDDDKQWKRWMNDIDNRWLRITNGTV